MISALQKTLKEASQVDFEEGKKLVTKFINENPRRG